MSRTNSEQGEISFRTENGRLDFLVETNCQKKTRQWKMPLDTKKTGKESERDRDSKFERFGNGTGNQKHFCLKTATWKMPQMYSVLCDLI